MGKKQARPENSAVNSRRHESEELFRSVLDVLTQHDPVDIAADNPHAAEEYEMEAREIVRRVRETPIPAEEFGEIVAAVLADSFGGDTLPDQLAMTRLASDLHRVIETSRN